MKQYEAVIETMERLGGIATLQQLNKEVFKITDCKWETKTPFASIRRIVQQNKEIYKIKPGLYALVSRQSQLEKDGFVIETDLNRNSKEVQAFNHAYYQGLLILTGNLRGMTTFVPAQDKNRMFYDGRKLSRISSIDSLPRFSYDHLVRRCSTVDVVWLNERQMPHSLFEVEHSTDMQNSLLKFNDLQDFHTRMVIVADKKREATFNDKMRYSAFKQLHDNDRVKFLDYDSLGRQYERLVEQQSFEVLV